MSNDNELNDLNIDQANEEELLDSDDSLEQESEDESVDDSEVKNLRSQVAKLTAIVKRHKERAQASSESKSLQNNQNNTQTPTRDEIFLVAQGYSEEDIDYLHLVANGAGLPLKEAKEHPLFVAHMEKVKADKRAKRASLGASKGSAPKTPVVTTGMTADDHKKLWREKMGVE